MKYLNDERLAELRIMGATLRQRLGVTAASVAETEDRIADTLDRLAGARPNDAERLRARATQARLFAAEERARAALYSAAPEPAEPAG